MEWEMLGIGSRGRTAEVVAVAIFDLYSDSAVLWHHVLVFVLRISSFSITRLASVSQVLPCAHIFPLSKYTSLSVSAPCFLISISRATRLA